MSAISEWCDGLNAVNKSPFLLFIRGDEVFVFRREGIPGVATIVEKRPVQRGELYRLALAPGVRMISGFYGHYTGTFLEGVRAAAGDPAAETWESLAEMLTVSIPTAKTFMVANWPEEAAAIRVFEAQSPRITLDDSLANAVFAIRTSLTMIQDGRIDEALARLRDVAASLDAICDRRRCRQMPTSTDTTEDIGTEIDAEHPDPEVIG